MPNCRVRELQVDLSVWIEFVGQGMAKDVGSYREGAHRQKVRAQSER
jgi:hypothetical protein